MNKIQSIQEEYKKLLTALLPKLKSSCSLEALDEINLFWIRHIDVIQLYLKALFPGKDSYVFTAATYMDFEDREHLPFLLIGDKHVLDDPLSKYSEIYRKIPKDNNVEFLCKQIELTAKDNIKILEDIGNNILILPLRLLNQSSNCISLFHIGEKFFVSLFNEIESLNDYFEKCNSIEDIMKYAHKNIGNMVKFSENDNPSLPFGERFKIALIETEYMVDKSKSDSYNFFMLVFGYIKQAVDVIVSCFEYECVPYIRHSVALHYISLLSECMLNINNITIIRYKMSVAFVVYRLIDKEQLAKVNLDDFLNKKQAYNFNQKLFNKFEHQGINENNFLQLQHSVKQLVVDELQEFYDFLN